MKINFTKKEYRLLLDMLDISDWVMSAFETEKDDKMEAYEALQQKVLSHSKEMDCEDIIKHDETLGGYYPTWEYEEGEHRNYIDAYDEDTFWDGLSHRLAARDLSNELGEASFDAMAADKRFEAVSQKEVAYEEEFKKNGLSNLKIVEKPILRVIPGKKK